MSWQPNQQGLQQIVQLIRESRTGNNETQKHVHASLEQLSKMPDYVFYLVFILTSMKNEADDIRQVAGIMLKNNLLNTTKQTGVTTLDFNTLQHIQVALLQNLNDHSAPVRSTIGSVLSTLAKLCSASPPAMGQLLQNLIKALDSGDQLVMDGAANALLKICEDMADQLDTDQLGRPYNHMIPRFISLLGHTDESIRNAALGSMVAVLELSQWPNALVASMQSFLAALFQLATADKSKKVRRKICQCFVILLDHVEYVKTHMNGIVDYMIHSTQDDDENVALDACEFWSTLAENENCQELLPILQPKLPALLPVLLNGMVYSEIDRMILGGEEGQEHEDVPDRPEDIAPSHYFHHAKMAGGDQHHHHPHAAKPEQSELAPRNQQQQMGEDDEDLDEEEEEEDEEFEEEDYDDVSEWNLRKCSASSLDVLSTVYGDPILHILLPEIQKRLAPSNEWYVRESAILALGAIAEGCYRGMEPHLGQLVPYLISVLGDPKPLVRSITCWTLSRYANWIVGNRQFLEPAVFELLKRMLDNNKRVQEAACSAFATFEEEAQSDLSPYLRPILETMSQAFRKYQAKNLLILYDAVGTLADAVGSDLNNPDSINLLMPPLMHKWNVLQDTDKNLFPLLECLTSVAGALGSGFIPFAPPVFQRCLSLIENTIMSNVVATQTGEEPVDKEFIVCALDLLSGLAEGLQANIEPLISGSNLLNLLFQCMKDDAPDVRQSAFALVGDLAKTCIGHLRTALNEYIPVLILNLNPTFISVCNNASWALGEIAVKLINESTPQVGGGIRPHALAILEKLIPIMNTTQLNRSLLENTAITIGRLGWVCPDLIAPHLSRFTENWCLSLRNIRNDVEKEDAFRGLCSMIRANPQGVYMSFAYVCDAIASWKNPERTLRQDFYTILHGFKQSMGAEKWSAYFSSFPAKLRTTLQEMYQL